MNGKILLDRKILDWGWWTDQNTAHLFVHLLLTASCKESTWRGELIPRGSLVTSLSSLSRDTGLSNSEVRTAMKHLESTGEITTKTTNRYTLINVLKYDDYQDIVDEKEV